MTWYVYVPDGPPPPPPPPPPVGALTDGASKAITDGATTP